MEKIVKEIIEKAKLKSVKIATAESCTGGLVASEITSLSGASEVFDMAIISYSNASKHKFLDVKLETLEKFGAVSEEAAKEMSYGLMAKSDATIALSITGIAGPNGGSENKPIGLVYIALAEKLTGRNKAYKFNFSGNRTEIRNQASQKALEIILEYINNKHYIPFQ